MTDSILNRYTGRLRSDVVDLHPDQAGEGTDDLGAFGWLRGLRDRAVMLELRKKTGTILAIGYAWLERAEFDPSEGITLHVMGRKIRIKGCNLNTENESGACLFQGLTRHRVPWIQETLASPSEHICTHTTVVEAIEW